MAEPKTKPTAVNARDFIAAIPDEARRRDCTELLRMMQEVADEPPRMWGPSIVGFGTYDFRYASGRTGTWPRVGFSPRKSALTLYLMLDLDERAELLARLGRHRRGKSCLYIRSLSDINTAALESLIRESCDQSTHSSCGGAHRRDGDSSTVGRLND